MYLKEKNDFLIKENVPNFRETELKKEEKEKIQAISYIFLNKFMEKVCDFVNRFVKNLEVNEVKNKRYKNSMKILKSIKTEYKYNHIKHEMELCVECEDKLIFEIFRKVTYKQQDSIIALKYLIEQIDNIFDFYNNVSIEFVDKEKFETLKSALQDIMDIYEVTNSYLLGRAEVAIV